MAVWFALAGVLALVCGVEGTAAVPWWNRAWRCRRLMTIDPKLPRRPGEEAIFAKFTTAGRVKPDGSDIRVVAGKQVVPHRVVMVGPGDRVSILFRHMPGHRKYYAYYDNPKAGALKTDWTPKRGLLLDTRPYRGGNCRNWKEMQATITQAGPAYNRAPVPTIFHGHNPFGPSRNFVSIYEGWLNVPRAGEYEFAISSASASFFFLDGKMFLRWGGWHGAVGNARFHKKVKLEAGLHQVGYYHVQGNANPYMVLVWRQGKERYKVVPPAAFMPPVKAYLSEYQILGKEVAPDFEWRRKGESVIRWASLDHMKGDPPDVERWLVKMGFSDRTFPLATGSVQREWDLGDGVVTTRPSPRHVYLAPGTYTVRLTVRREGKKVSVSQKVVVDRDWGRQTKEELDTVTSVANVIRHYPFQKMTGPSVYGAMHLYAQLDRTKELLSLGDVMLKKLKELPEKEACEAAELLAKRWRREGGDPAKAVAVLRTGEASLGNVDLRARLSLILGDTIYYFMNQPATAKPEYERVTRRYAAAKRHARQAYMRIGDISREFGNLEEARHFYGKSIEFRAARPAGREALDMAMRSLETEDYLRRGELEAAEDALNLWQWQNPETKVRGQWSVLRVRLALAENDLGEAAKESEILLRVNPESQYAPELLLLLARARVAGKRPDLARAALERVKTDYPDSPLVHEAETEIKKLSEKRTPPKRKPAKKRSGRK